MLNVAGGVLLQTPLRTIGALLLIINMCGALYMHVELNDGKVHSSKRCACMHWNLEFSNLGILHHSFRTFEVDL